MFFSAKNVKILLIYETIFLRSNTFICICNETLWQRPKRQEVYMRKAGDFINKNCYIAGG